MIFSDHHNEIYVDESSGIIHAVWKGLLKYEDVKKGCEVMTDYIKKHDTKFHLSDHRSLKVLSKEIQNYLKEEWFPSVEKEGLIKIGVVVAEDVFAKATVDKIKTAQYGKMIINTFDSPTECEKWLIN